MNEASRVFVDNIAKQMKGINVILFTGGGAEAGVRTVQSWHGTDVMVVAFNSILGANLLVTDLTYVSVLVLICFVWLH
jgi:hypothetical protein